MNNFIIITRTYSETTPESLNDGDFSDTGFIAESENVSFTELVQLMKEHPHPSQSPNNGNTDVWYESSWFAVNYNKGIERSTAIHFHRDNTENACKYWKWAASMAMKERI